MKNDILALRSELTFDPRYLVSDPTKRSAEAFTRRIAEYKVWSMGNSALIRKFYTEGNSTNGDAREAIGKMNYFWALAPTNVRMIHSGIPGLISTRMADILFKGGLKAKAIVYKDDSADNLDENKELSKKATELLALLMNLTDTPSRLRTGATNESWGGHCFFRLSHDIEISNFPILETFDVTQAEIVKARGITKAIIFKKWYEHGDTSYRLNEIYSTTEDGDACITYRLYRCTYDGEVEVNLLSIPQTYSLFRVDGRGAQDGIPLDKNNTFVYHGLKGILAFEKPNKTPSLEFPNSVYGASDYEGAIDNFDALDEVVSGNIAEIRTNKTRRYIPRTLIPRNEEGEVLPFDDFDDSYVKHEADQDQNAENKIEVVTVQDKTASFLDKWKSILSIICNKAKISPYSLGITWLEAVGPSADSLRERNKTTLDMRDGKLGLWKPMLEEMLLRMLQLCSWMRKNTNADMESVPELDITWENATVKVEFGEYLEESMSERLTIWGDAKAKGAVSIEKMVYHLYPYETEKDRKDEVNRIRFEAGMSADNPSSLPELAGEDEEE